MVTIIYWTGLGQITMFRLRIGYNRLNSTQNIQVGSAVIFTCTCGQAPQTAEHIVQPVHLRNVYSVMGGNNPKDYENLRDFQKTVQFMQEPKLQ